jgi:hypothetical protein
MTLPEFTTERSLYRRNTLSHRNTLKDTGLAQHSVIMAALPSECQRPGASRPYTDTKCYGVVLVRTDKCRVPDGTIFGREVSGFPYPCGICFGFPW